MKLLFDISSVQPQGSMIINGGGGYALAVLVNLCRYISDKTLQVNKKYYKKRYRNKQYRSKQNTTC